MTKQKPLVLIEGAENINKAIDSLKGRSSSIDREIHLTAVSIVKHIEKCGDYTQIARLIDALPKSARTNALKDWFVSFSKVEYDVKNKSFYYNKEKASLLAEAEATPFWEFKPEAEYKPFDIVQALNSLIKRAEKAIEHGDNVPQAQVEALRTLIAKPAEEPKETQQATVIDPLLLP